MQLTVGRQNYSGSYQSKIWMIMRMTMFFMLVGVLQISAKGLAQKVSFSGKEVPLEVVFEAVQKQTGHVVFYNKEILKGRKGVTMDVKEMELRRFMEECLKGEELEFSVEGRMVVVVRKHKIIEKKEDPPVKISGTVVGRNNQPLSGATIRVKGKNVNTTTDEKGFFNLDVEIGNILVISYVGFNEREFKVTTNEVVKIQLYQMNIHMDTTEIIINTGYQKISSERFVGSYSILDSAKFHRNPGLNILDRLDGMVSGVFFNRRESVSPIQIRGISTINGRRDPLIIVDNFPYPYDLNTINPNDIDNIVVLKDAAAISVWGSRAGNGVIVITTKKAKFNQPLNISVQSNITITGKPRLKESSTISSSDFIEVEKFLFKRGHYTSALGNNIFRPVVTPVVEILDRIDKGIINESDGMAEIEQMKNYDIRDELLKYVYKPQVNQQYSASVSGGSQLINYGLSVGYTTTGPFLQNSKGMDQFNINSSAAFKPVKNLEISVGIGLNQLKDRSTVLPPIQSYPYMRLKNENGDPASVVRSGGALSGGLRIGYVDTAGGGQLLDWHFRPLDEIQLADKITEARLMNLNLGVSYQIFPWLNVQMLAQQTNSIRSTENLYSLEAFEARNLINQYTNLKTTVTGKRYPVPVGGILDVSGDKATGTNFRGQLNFNKAFGTNHSIQGTITAEVSESKSSGFSHGFYGYNSQVKSYQSNIDFNDPYPLYGGRGSGYIPARNNISIENINRAVSLISYLSYTYKNSLNFYANIRRDGANVFGVTTNNKWKPLWSIGGSWFVSKEKFFDLGWLSSLKLRTSYGYSGNTVNMYSGYTTIIYSPFSEDYTGLNSASLSNPPNPNLRWEEVRMQNIGIDFILKNNRFRGSIDLFRKTSEDLIGSIPIAPSRGVSSAFVNSGNLKGKGFDINLSADIIRGEINWDAGVNFSYAKVKVTKIYQSSLMTRDFLSFGINPVVGEIAYALYSYKWGGLDPATGNPRGILAGKPSTEYARIGQDTLSNQVLHGSSIPLYNGNILNSFSWRKFSLSFNITFKFNYYVRKPALNYKGLYNDWNGIDEFIKRWQKPGDENHTTVPSMIYPIPQQLDGRDEFYRNAEVNVLRGDHIRLNDFRLQYSPTYRIRSIERQFTMFAVVNNINFLLWKKNRSGYDPELLNANGYMPVPKTVTIGVNFNL